MSTNRSTNRNQLLLKSKLDEAFNSLRSGKYEEALSTFKEFKKTNANELRAIDLHIARCYLRMKKYDEAKKSLEFAEKVIKNCKRESLFNELYLTYSSYYRMLFESSQKREYFDEALKYASKAPFSRDKAVLMEFALCYKCIKNYQQAMEYVNTILKTNPKDAPANHLKLQLIILIDPKEAKNINEQQFLAITATGNEVSHQLSKGNLLEKQNKFDEAEKVYQEGMKKFPDTWQFSIGYASFLQKKRRDDKTAFALAKKVIDFDSTLPPNKQPSPKELADCYNILAIAVDFHPELSKEKPIYFIREGLKKVADHQALISLRAKLIPDIEKRSQIYEESHQANPEQWNTRHGIKNAVVPISDNSALQTASEPSSSISNEVPESKKTLKQCLSSYVSDAKKRRIRRKKAAKAEKNKPKVVQEALPVLQVQKTSEIDEPKQIEVEATSQVQVPKTEELIPKSQTEQSGAEEKNQQLAATKPTVLVSSVAPISQATLPASLPRAPEASLCRKLGIFALSVTTAVVSGYVLYQHKNFNP